MSNIEMKHLIRSTRLPEYKLLCLIFYLPVGVILFTLRIILALSLITLGYILSDAPVTNKIINKIACLTLGISVTVENPKMKENVDIYISNSLSIFDQLALHSATGSVTPGMKPNFIKSKGLGIHCCGSESNLGYFKKNIDVLTENKIPVHFRPEGKMTNGKALLKFKSYPFQFSLKVQPVCISIERPFLDISVTKCGSSYFNDVLFFMFSPLTNYKLKFLSPLEKKSLSDEEFAEIVRQNIGVALKVETTDFTASDLIEWEKRKVAEEQVQSNFNRLPVNAELRRMTLQVKEVLPHVPFNAIYNDLNITRNVDNTITNILDGRVQYVEEIPIPTETPTNNSQPSTSSFKSSPLAPADSSNSVLFNTAASSFAKSANERTKSFYERKQQLIANARRRFIEKHNLDIPL